MDKSSSACATKDKVAARALPARQIVVIMALAVLTACAITETSGATVSANCPVNKSDPSMVELFYYSDVVVLAKVLKQYRAAPEAQSFTAELQLFCVFKGKDLPQRMNVSNAGKVENQCFETQFTVGNSYLVYLQKDNGGARFTPVFRHHPDTYKDEIYSMCDVNISYPLGVDPEKSDVVCEDDYPEYDYPAGEEYEYDNTDCIPPFVPPTPETEKEASDMGDNNMDNNGGEDDKETEGLVAQTKNKVSSENNNEQGNEVSDNGNDKDNEDNTDNTGKGVPYSEGNGNVKVDSTVDDGSGSSPLRMSLVLLTLLHCVVLMFS